MLYRELKWEIPNQITKDIANYIYNTYGRFPKSANPITCPALMQVHHMDIDFYEKYLIEGSTWREQREHLKVWHGLDEE